ncbi:MAG: HAD family hydrolase [Lachnospiraceae bacterium]|nr:HAD family hydrolase [Lachnospiraceae bacterium]
MNKKSIPAEEKQGDATDMDIKLVLFDLDGTLLPMNQDEFTKGYFKLLVNTMVPYGYDSEKLVGSVWSGISAMVKNNGKQSNEEVFWERFGEIYGRKAADDKPLFEEFYRCEFQEAKELCGYNPKAGESVRKIKGMGIKVALATNPVFPNIATVSRMAWAGLKPSDFEWYTTYENIGFCKPNPEYYREVVKRLRAKPEETLMVGNDVEEDMEAGIAAGVNVFLLTDCLINRERRDINQYPRGSFEQLMGYIWKNE